METNVIDPNGVVTMSCRQGEGGRELWPFLEGSGFHIEFMFKTGQNLNVCKTLYQLIWLNIIVLKLFIYC